LLYWISHCGTAPFGLVALRRSGFNPCCIGLAIAALRSLPRHRGRESFQSLLYWISHCGHWNGRNLHPDPARVSILVVLD